MRFQPTLLSVFLLTATVSAQAQFSFTTNADGSLNVSAFSGSNQVQIPSTVNGIKVSGIADLAFAESAATSIGIPSTVRNIGSQAFLFSASLTNLAVDSNNLIYASSGAVLFNRSLTTLAAFPCGISGVYSIPASVKSVGPFAFAGSELADIHIPTNVTTIGPQAFWACGNLGSVVLPGSITSFGSFAFWACPGLTNATLSQGLTAIAADTFSQCASLQTVTIANTITNIGVGAFQFCGSLRQITFPPSITTVGSSAFAGCSALSTLYFLGNAPVVGSSSFQGDTTAAACYLPGATGWPTFHALPAGPWNAVIQGQNTNFGLRNGVFGFDITGTTNSPVVVEASSSPKGGWNALTNGALSGGLLHVNDADWSNHVARFYRVRTP